MDVNGSVRSYVLSNVAEVVERILSFVPTKSLLRMASVCRLWRNCARRVLRTQQQMTWLAASGSSRVEGHVLLRTLSEELEYNGDVDLETQEKTYEVEGSYNAMNEAKPTPLTLENVHLLPQMALLVVDSENFSSPECCYQQKKARRTNSEDPDFVGLLKHLLPDNCDIIGIATPGIILTPVGSPAATPEEHEDGEAGFALLLPHIEGVRVRPFHFCKHTLNNRALEQAGLLGNPDLKVVLLFGYMAFKSGASRFLNQFLEPLSHTNALIAGGHVERAFCPHRDCCSAGAYGVVGLTLSGARVQGASVLLEQEVSSATAAEAVLQRLKAAHIPEHNTIGLMFACVGRGHNYYNNQRNVEAGAFRKLFPNVPLFGFFGNGEIGCDRIVKENFTLSHTDTDGLQHGYTTVMSLVHLG